MQRVESVGRIASPGGVESQRGDAAGGVGTPVVLFPRALAPVAVLLFPVVLFCSALAPLPVLEDPALFTRVLAPVAVL